MAGASDYAESQRRENLVEHCIIADLLQDAWLRRNQMLDILRSEVDAAGYDLVLVCNGITRHVQLKSSIATSRSGYQAINGHLSNAPSGCVVWVRIRDDREANRLRLEYWFFGNDPGKALDDLSGLPKTKHTRANALGQKGERSNAYRVTRGKFRRLAGVEDLSDVLFGPPVEIAK